MKIHQLLLTALVAVLFVGCGGGGNSGNNVTVAPQSASPTETLKNFIEASKKRDVEAIKKALSKNSLIMAERVAQSQNTTVNDLFSRENPALPNEVPEIRNEKIEGETASVEVKDPNGGYETIPFVKEEGVWKIAFDKYQQALIDKTRQDMNASETNSSKPDGEKSPSNKQPAAPVNKPKTNK